MVLALPLEEVTGMDSSAEMNTFPLSPLLGFLLAFSLPAAGPGLFGLGGWASGNASWEFLVLPSAPGLWNALGVCRCAGEAAYLGKTSVCVLKVSALRR